MKKKVVFFAVTLVGMICFSQILYVPALAVSERYDSTYLKEVNLGHNDLPTEMTIDDLELEKGADEDKLLDGDSEEARFLKNIVSENISEREDDTPDPDAIYSEIVLENPVESSDFEDWKEAEEEGEINDNVVILSVYADMTDEEIQELCDELDGKIESSYVVDDVAVLRVNVGDSIEAAETCLENDLVLKAAPEQYMTPCDIAYTTDTINDTFNSYNYNESIGIMWTFDTLQTEYAWDIVEQTIHNRIKVAVLDAGVPLNNDFGSNVLLDDYYDTIKNSEGTASENYISGWHSTAVTSTLAATSNNQLKMAGIASGWNNDVVEVLPINIAEDIATYHNSNNIGDTKAGDGCCAEGIFYAVDAGCDIINISYTVKNNANLENACWYAYNHGVTIVAAAGNDGEEIKKYPAAHNTVIGVMATAYNNMRADFSNYGEGYTVEAPGVNVPVLSNSDNPDAHISNSIYEDTDERGTVSNGTSFSTPMISGIAAMMLSVNPDLTPNEIKDFIEKSCSNYSIGWSATRGYGVANAWKAVSMAASAVDNNDVDVFSKEQICFNGDNEILVQNISQNDISVYYTTPLGYSYYSGTKPAGSRFVILCTESDGGNGIYTISANKKVTARPRRDNLQYSTYNFPAQTEMIVITDLLYRVSVPDVTYTYDGKNHGLNINVFGALNYSKYYRVMKIEQVAPKHYSTYYVGNYYDSPYTTTPNVTSMIGTRPVYYKISVTGKPDYYGLSTVYINPFSDITDGSCYYHTPTCFCYTEGLLNGFKDGTFKPLNAANRVAVIVALYRYSGKPTVSTNISFSDMTGNSEFDKAIKWAYQKGIASGFNDNTFRPFNDCSRVAVITFLWRYAGCPTPTMTASFSDMPGNSDFANAISWAVEKGITTGYSDNTFRPYDACTRANLATFLFRYYKYIDNGPKW